MGKYDDIIDQLTKAERPSRELDARIWALIGWGDYAPDTLVNGRTMHEAIEKFPQDMTGIARAWEVDRFTASLDAAIAITERLLPGWLWGVDKRGGCLLYKEDAAAKGGYSTKLKVEANTPALSMLLAAFTALQAQDRE